MPSPAVPPPPPPSETPEGHRPIVGRVIGDKYGVTGLIGEGGMGAVYEAEHLAIGRLVAVKVLHPRHAAKPDASTRLHHEARVAGTIGHPNICEIYDIGRLDDGSPYLVMERLHGESLAERIQREGFVRHGDLSEIMVQVLSALVVAHEKGIIHRDLKPDNIFLSQRVGMPPIAKLLDFGISKANHIDDTAVGLTKTGMVMGTPYYMAPEQARGDRTLDHRVDLWAVGVVLYEALSGRRPFVARNYNALLVQILTAKHRPLKEVKPEVPTGLCEIVDRALAKMREDRFQNARDFQEQLLHYRGAVSRPMSTVPPAPPAVQPAQATQTTHAEQVAQAVQAAKAVQAFQAALSPDRSALGPGPGPGPGTLHRVAPTPTPGQVQERGERRARGRRASDKPAPAPEPIWETSARGSVQVGAKPPSVNAPAPQSSEPPSNAAGSGGPRSNVSPGGASPGSAAPGMASPISSSRGGGTSPIKASPGGPPPGRPSPGSTSRAGTTPGIAPGGPAPMAGAPSGTASPGSAPRGQTRPGFASPGGDASPISVSPGSISQSHSISVDVSVSEVSSSFGGYSQEEATVVLPGGAMGMPFHDSFVEEETPALPIMLDDDDIELTMVDPPKFLSETATLVGARRIPPPSKK